MIELICETECKIFSDNGYTPMIYASKSWFDTKLNSPYLEEYEKWLAWWNDKAEFDKNIYSIWQYTSRGIIDGINGYVDLNYAYKNYEKENKNMNDKVYNSIDELPLYAKPTFKKLINKKLILGNENGLDLNERMVRTFVILDRAGIFDK